MYHYVADKRLWGHSEAEFNLFKEWAKNTQENFEANHFTGKTFAFWADPEDVDDYFESAGLYVSIASLRVDVGVDAKPEMKHKRS